MLSAGAKDTLAEKYKFIRNAGELSNTVKTPENID